jgi:hypothetical protein
MGSRWFVQVADYAQRWPLGIALSPVNYIWFNCSFLWYWILSSTHAVIRMVVQAFGWSLKLITPSIGL